MARASSFAPSNGNISEFEYWMEWRTIPFEGAKLLARAIYAAIICIPLLLSSVAQVRVFGWLILGSVVFGFLFLSYAFTSVWCFLAAVLSAYIYVVLRRTPRPAN